MAALGRVPFLCSSSIPPGSVSTPSSSSSRSTQGSCHCSSSPQAPIFSDCHASLKFRSLGVRKWSALLGSSLGSDVVVVGGSGNFVGRKGNSHCSSSTAPIFSNCRAFLRFRSFGLRKSSSWSGSSLGGEISVVGGSGNFVGRSGIAVAFDAAPGTEELPAKLQEIVRLFQQVTDPRAKYQQLLYYAKQLKPLGKEHCTKENKVEGCVSQVWVRPTLNVETSTICFEADSDSLLTKGLAALLVEGLSGSTVAEVLKVTPDFVQMLGLKQSLTPSRSNGFLNMLKLMQKKTLQMYMEAEAGKSSSAASAREYGSQVGVSVGQAVGIQAQMDSGASVNGANSSSADAPEQRSMKSTIEKKLQEALAPTVLVVDDVSHQHAGHAGVHKGATETHFNVNVISDKFTGNSLIKRHRLVYNLLDKELKNGVHALSLVTKSPSEPA